MILPSLYGAKSQSLYDDVMQLCECGVRCFHFDIFDESVNKQLFSGLEDFAFLEDLFNKYYIIKNLHVVSRHPWEYFSTIIDNKIEEVILHPELIENSEINGLIIFLQEQGVRVGLSFNKCFLEYTCTHMDFIHVCNYDYFNDRPLSVKQISDNIVKLRRLEKPILVDGGVCCDNIALYKAAGASSFVCGKSLFSYNPVKSYLQLLKLIN